LARVFVLVCVSFEKPPNVPFEHDLVNLVVILVTQILASFPTQKWVVFVSASVQVCVFLAQLCPKREVVVRVALRERLTLAHAQRRSESGKMGEENAW
jgi:hypothetical protein